MKNEHNAKYAFYYLFSLVALIFMTLSVGMIVFSIIDRTITDVLSDYYNNNNAQLRFAISALLISAPIFYITSNFIQRGLRKEELTKDSGVRRWLTYFIILVSAIVILGVFIGVINNFLSGELTSRFVFKSLTVFIIAAAVFSFYLYNIKKEVVIKKDGITKIFLIVSLILVSAAFIAAWFFVESPRAARDARLDQTVVNNIYRLESAVNSYYGKYHKLPDNLEMIWSEGNLILTEEALINPVTRLEIEYKKIDENSFEFCTEFKTNNKDDIDDRYSPISMIEDKRHEAGYQCLAGNLWNRVNK